MKKTLVKEGPRGGALTGNGQVGVGLDFPRHVPGEALEHAGVVGQEAVHLQAASHQDPVPEHLHRVDGHGVLVPDDVGLRHSCDRPPRLTSGHVSRKAGRTAGALTSRLAGNVHHLLHLRCDVSVWFFHELRRLCGTKRKKSQSQALGCGFLRT